MEKNLIFESKDLRVIPDVMEMIKKSKIDGVDLAEMELFIRTNLGKKDIRLWISFNGDKITGFVLAYLVFPILKPEVFIAWTYIDPKEKKLGESFIRVVENWARSNGIKKISAFVRDNLKAFEEKYGFKLDYYGVSKILEDKEE